MAINAPSSFSYAPKIQPALASLAPVGFGSGIRFEKSAPIVMRDQNLAAPAQGYWAGRQALTEDIAGGILSSLGKVLDAYVGKRQKEIDKKESDEKSALEHTRAVELANIRADKDDEDLTRQIKQKQLEKLTQEVDERVDEVVPSEVRKRGYFKDNPDLLKTPVEVPLPTQSSVTGDSSTAIAGIDYNLPEPLAEKTKNALTDLQLPEVTTDSIAKSMARNKSFEPPVMVPAGTGEKIVLQGEELSLNPISTSGIPMQQAAPLAALPPVVTTPAPPVVTTPPTPVAPASPEVNQTLTRYEMEDYFAGAPYESLPDAKYAAEQLTGLGYKTKILSEGSGKQKIFYIDYERPDEVQVEQSVPAGMQVKSVKDVDGKREVSYEPEVPIKQQIEQVAAPLNKLKTMVEQIDKINTIVGGVFQGAGGLSEWIQYLPFPTDASNTRELLENIKANIAFETLAEMRKNSPTGGALGSVTENELKMLAATKGSISPKLSLPIFKANLNKIREETQNVIDRIERDVQYLQSGKNSNQQGAAQPQYKNGQTAVGPNGERIVFQNGTWVPVK